MTTLTAADDLSLRISADLGPQVTARRLSQTIEAVTRLVEFHIQTVRLSSILTLLVSDYARVQLSDSPSTVSTDQIQQVLNVFGVSEAEYAEVLSSAMTTGGQTPGVLRGRLADEFFRQRDDVSMFGKLPPITSHDVYVRRLEYSNPLVILMGAATSLMLGLKGLSWAIEKWQSIRKSHLEIQKLKLEIEGLTRENQIARGRDRDPEDLQRDAAFQTLASQIPAPAEESNLALATIQASLHVTIYSELSIHTQDVPAIREAAAALQSLPPDTDAELLR